MKKHKEEEQSPYSGIEKQLLNTFFAGVYISAKELVLIGRELELGEFSMKNRELLLKQLFTKAHSEKRVPKLFAKLENLVEDRNREYAKLLQKYPNSRNALMPLIQKSHATKRVLR